jgi:pimeloyl-ACP methyl ester carboxylesterase
MPANEWKRVALGGGSLVAFERSGPMMRAPLVLLHGAGANALTWLPIQAAFANRRTLLVDMPAHGESAPPASWALDGIAANVARAVNTHLGGKAAVWGGHSWGGKVAGLVAASGSHCSSLLLVDPSPSSALPVDIDSFIDGIWSIEMQPHASPDAALAAARSLPHWQPWSDDLESAFRHGLARRADGSWSLRPARTELFELATAVLHGDANEQLARNHSVPTLLVIAEESAAWQGITNAVTYAHATQVVVPGNHWIHIANAGAVAPVARSFLDSLAS